MASVLNRTTLQYLASVNTPDYPVLDWVHSPDISAVVGVAAKYWKLTGDVVSEMSQAEKDAVDAAETAAATTADKDSAKQLVDLRDLVGVVQTLVDELNVLRTWIRDFKTAVAGAATLAALKTAVAALPNLPDRTYTQARTAIRDRIDTL